MPSKLSVGGCIILFTTNDIWVLGNDLNIYIISFLEKKNLKNPLFKEGLCVEVLFTTNKQDKLENIEMIYPAEEGNG